MGQLLQGLKLSNSKFQKGDRVVLDKDFSNLTDKLDNKRTKAYWSDVAPIGAIHPDLLFGARDGRVYSFVDYKGLDAMITNTQTPIEDYDKLKYGDYYLVHEEVLRKILID